VEPRLYVVALIKPSRITVHDRELRDRRLRLRLRLRYDQGWRRVRTRNLSSHNLTRHEPADAELIAAVLQGDSASFEPLVRKYQPRVFVTARR